MYLFTSLYSIPCFVVKLCLTGLEIALCISLETILTENEWWCFSLQTPENIREKDNKTCQLLFLTDSFHWQEYDLNLAENQDISPFM